MACCNFYAPPEGVVVQYNYLFWLRLYFCIFSTHFYIKTIKRMMEVKNKLKAVCIEFIVKVFNVKNHYTITC